MDKLSIKYLQIDGGEFGWRVVWDLQTVANIQNWGLNAQISQYLKLFSFNLASILVLALHFSKSPKIFKLQDLTNALVNSAF